MGAKSEPARSISAASTTVRPWGVGVQRAVPGELDQLPGRWEMESVVSGARRSTRGRGRVGEAQRSGNSASRAAETIG